MSRNNTGNPIGSKAFADFEDNVKNLDEAVNTADPQWVDRLGRFRLPLMEQERQFVSDQERREGEFQADQSSREAVFSDFLQASGYQDLGEYGPGIEITAHNQYVTFGGKPYLLKPSISVPYTTSGEWTGDDFKLIGDDALRQDLANPDMGAAMVARGVVSVTSTSQLSAVPTDRGLSAYLHDADRSGIFSYVSEDLSSSVTADPLRAWFIAPSHDTSGASGAWVRRRANLVMLQFFAGVTFEESWAAANELSNLLNLPLFASGRKETVSGIQITAKSVILDRFEITASSEFNGEEVVLFAANDSVIKGELTVDNNLFDTHAVKFTAANINGNDFDLVLKNTNSPLSSQKFPCLFYLIQGNDRLAIRSITCVSDVGTNDLVRVDRSENIHIGTVATKGSGSRTVAANGKLTTGLVIDKIISLDAGRSAFYSNDIGGAQLGYVYARGVKSGAGLKFSRGSANVTVEYVDIEVGETGDQAILFQGAQNCHILNGKAKTSSTGTTSLGLGMSPHSETLDDCFDNSVNLQTCEGSAGVYITGHPGLGLYGNRLRVDHCIGTGVGTSLGGVVVRGENVGDTYVNGGVYETLSSNIASSNSGISLIDTNPAGSVFVKGAAGIGVEREGIYAQGDGSNTYNITNCTGITKGTEYPAIRIRGLGYLAYSIAEGGTGVVIGATVGDYYNQSTVSSQP